MSAKSLKKLFRSEIKSKLISIPTESIQSQSQEIARQVLLNADYKGSRRISVFLNMEGEVETEEIVRDIFRSGMMQSNNVGKQCFVPMCNPKTMVS